MVEAQSMATKDELQNILKEKYGVNKNISQALDRAQCERLLSLLEQEPSAAKLVESFTQKNSSLGRNNAYYSRMRNQAENKLENLKTEYQELEASIKSLEESKLSLEHKKTILEQEQERLETEIQSLSSRNITLDNQVKTLSTHNTELLGANETLKKDNRRLKMLIDQIKLRLAQDTKELLQYEDNQLRKAIIRLFRWTLG
jgi:chromosome segregation ATPase